MDGSGGASIEFDRVRADGEWWVLVVTDGFTIEFPPELYRDQDSARSEAERWARLLSRRSRAAIERPFDDRWQVGDEWIRLTHAFLPEEGPEIWVITYWTRDGYPEPEAELIADAAEARAWVLEARIGAALLESHDTPWSAAARFRVRGGEEEAEAHRAKVVSALVYPTQGEVPDQTVHGFEVSEGFIPRGPDLFRTEASRDEALRAYLEQELAGRDWRDLVLATASGNYVEHDLPGEWRETWDSASALDWLLGFDFISDGDKLEIRRFETSVSDEDPAIS